MDNKACIIRPILWGLGILLLLAAGLDVLPLPDNQVIFVALACFIVNAVLKRIAKAKDSCCK